MNLSPARRRLVGLLLASVAVVAGFAWALHGLDLATLAERVRALPTGLWLLAALTVLASHALRATRLHAEWQVRTGADWAACLRLCLLHNAAVLLLPLRSGELGYGLWLQQRWGVGWKASSASLLWMRLQDVIVLLALTGAAWFAPSPWLALVAPVGLAVLHAAFASITGLGRQHRIAWLCATANWSLRLAVVGALLAELTGLTLAATLRGALGGEWAAVLPLQAPGGLGTYEAGVWAGLNTLAAGRAVAIDQVVAAALIVHLFWLAVSLLAAWPALLLDGDRAPLPDPTP
ncbi:lysylphosphatidylglycerol synthase domain-containing protein [Leptothrix discophora]|uniref:Uncharacterized protein n=1 Tax=Leptothrix discophora TaxID=89 RepID=A0ABT9G769_LEPDI|nr:lysylphosphatidylglycerol synthase domain-containing protein [Leptothrix discophora]MDP4302102.1 hypothetical protein [Leptothrix discophora]